MAGFTKDNLPDWFCPVPFAGIIFNPEGNVTACRELGASHWLGDIRRQSWQEIWNGEGFRSLRREFLTGEIKTCAEHIRHRKCHKDGWNQELIQYIDLTEVQIRPPVRLSPDFNGRCNLRCEMCLIWKKPNGLYDELDFWSQAERELYPFLKQVDPLSGEPFMQKDTYRLMEFMAKTNPKAVWKITTNGHWKFTRSVREHLEGLDFFTINVSVDSLVEENYARIRRDGDLKVVLQTIDDLVKYRDEREKERGSTFRLVINTLVQVHNWREMGDFVTYARARKATPFIQFLYGPRELSVLSLSTAERRDILDFYLKTIDGDDLRDYCGRAMKPLMDSFRKASSPSAEAHAP